MDIIPAIDIMERKVVRLRQGKFDKGKVYSKSPVLAAEEWKASGARLIHVVDLDGARLGRPACLDIVAEIVKNVPVDIEVGGGLRSVRDVEDVFAAGARFAVIGTGAVEDGAFRARLMGRFGDKIIFAVDIKNGKVAVKGWEEVSQIGADAYIKELETSGAKKIIYTDVSRDGMMTGPNLALLKSILRLTSLEVIASGGIRSIEDIKALKELEKNGLRAVIVGKALYEGKIDFEEAINVS